MRRALPTMHAAPPQRSEGMALILTLAILVVLSILVVSLVSMASLDRGATQNYAQSLRAEQVALGGLDQIITQLQGEITDPALSTNSNPVGSTNNLYIPLADTASIPQRTATWSSNFATVLAYSGVRLYAAGSGATDFSSASATQNKSLNSRYISAARWNKPQLMTSPSGFPSPQWILMTRAGPQAFTAYNNTLANSSALNNSYAVGRYAYVIYDTSGLLDANVAGYPTGAKNNASGKGLMPWADLTQFSGISQSDVDNLVKWRNAATSSDYANRIFQTATNNAFTRVANGDTCFLSRQELIKYAQTQNTALASALPYLTTFSREVNGPTWGPSTPAGSTIDYASQQYTQGTFNPRLPNPRVQAAFTRNNGLQAVAGEPLVKYRFPIEKLALLEKLNGTGTSGLTASDITDIQKYFGLDVATDANGPSYRHWVYPTTNSTYIHGVLSGATGIMTLDDVAKQNREPDFFELLQAGILSGSLGEPGKSNPGRSDQQPVNGNGSSSFVDPDNSVTLHILRIGANIIDQWDADSFPTTVTLNPPTGSGAQSVSVYGIEDLPYPFAAYLNAYASGSGTTGPSSIPTALPPFNFYIYFALWNPHQTPSSVNPANYPSSFRFLPFYNSSIPQYSDTFVVGFANSKVPVGGTPPAYKSASWFYNGTPTTANGSNGSHTPYYLIQTASNGIPFSYSPTGTAYREPTLAVGTTSSVPSPWNSIACLALPQQTNFPNAGKPANQNGVNTPFPANSSGPSGPDSAWQTQIEWTLVMPVQYKDASNNWHTYGTFIGLDDPSGAYPSGTCYDSHYGWNPVATTASLSCYSLVKSDPRTFRFGVGADAYQSGTVNVNLPLATSAGAMNNPVNGGPPFGAAGVATSTPYRLDMWAANDSAVTLPNPNSGSPYYSDIDHIQRWGDARNSYKLQNSGPLFANANANRPVILNRPFQSVGEMGYAYRDMPWKTLDFFSSNSADSGLLDLFTLGSSPVAAGRVNPNTPYPQVLAALIAGAVQSTANGTTVSSDAALSVGQAIRATTSLSPFINRADIVNRFMTDSALTSSLAPGGIKTEEESVIRALAESSNTRTWNFLIDIIAQAGRYPVNASGLDDFFVDGERRYWLHIAIDRYTGQIIDRQLEVVNE